jgi:type IV pilus assembly protein PilW
MNHGTPIRHVAAQGSMQGLSLIELMIAMAIGLILITTIGYAYVGAKQSFRAQDALSRIQENARYAFEFMAADVRMAGFTGGTGTGTNVVNDPTTWDPKLKDLFGFPLYGQDDTTPANVTACGSPLVSACYLRGDTLNVVRADNETEYAISAHADPNITLAAATTEIAAGRLMVLADYTNAAVFQIFSISGTTVNYATGGGSPGNASSSLGSFSGALGARKLYRLRGVTYFIGSNLSGEPALYRRVIGPTGGVSSEELVEGVQDMQITYGVDTDSTVDANVNSYVSASVVTNDTGSIFPAAANTASLRWKRVLAARITLTLRSRQELRVATSGDGYLRKTIVNTIAIRNRLQ